MLDLDETLVHSSFRPIPNPDFVIPVEIEGKVVDVYVLKRPHMDHFMAEVGSRFEVVVFTASLSKYAGVCQQQLATSTSQEPATCHNMRRPLYHPIAVACFRLPL